ncbi:MAG: flavodoxin family protein [Vicinamibacteria bacterium]
MRSPPSPSTRPDNQGLTVMLACGALLALSVLAFAETASTASTPAETRQSPSARGPSPPAPSAAPSAGTPVPDEVRVLIAYHSAGGHTAALAQAVAEGARREPFVLVSLEPVAKVTCAELLATDALIVGSPVYWSNMSAEVKKFFDDFTLECGMLPPGFPMRDKLGAAFVTAGEEASGKETTLAGLLAAMLGNRMLVLSEGQALGATATTGEGGLPLKPEAFEEGRRLGQRVAATARLLKRGRESPAR